jgi:two-component system phosphate regulon response regulator PhoB
MENRVEKGPMTGFDSKLKSEGLTGRAKILIVDDDEDTRELIAYNLVKEGYLTKGVSTGEQAVEEARNHPSDLIILDLMLPGIDGLEVCRILKRNDITADIPIIILTAKGGEADVVTGLELGADDYVTKPFSPRVLLARIRAVLRRKGADVSWDDDSNEKVIRIQDLTIDAGKHEARFKDRPLMLTPTEFTILLLLAGHPGRVFERRKIIKALKGDPHSVTKRSIDVQIVGLRKKLGDGGNYIQSIRGVGYRIVDA